MDGHVRFRWLACVVVAASLLIGGCASSTPVTDAPLEVTKLQQLRETMVGTWMHTYTEDADGNREQEKTAQITWTFNKDGTGEYHQIVPSVGMDSKKDFKWQLEGRNIRLENGAADPTYYRADDWKADHMKWFNYKLSDYYIVEKQ